MICEKCWRDAAAQTDGDPLQQVDMYYQLLSERSERPCTAREQAGFWWDESTQSDRRRDMVSDHKGA